MYDSMLKIENRMYKYSYNDHVTLSVFCNLAICSVICVYELGLVQQTQNYVYFMFIICFSRTNVLFVLIFMLIGYFIESNIIHNIS